MQNLCNMIPRNAQCRCPVDCKASTTNETIRTKGLTQNRDKLKAVDEPDTISLNDWMEQIRINFEKNGKDTVCRVPDFTKGTEVNLLANWTQFASPEVQWEEWQRQLTEIGVLFGNHRLAVFPSTNMI